MNDFFIVKSVDGVAIRYDATGKLLSCGTLEALAARHPEDQVIELRSEPAQVEECRRLEAARRTEERRRE